MSAIYYNADEYHQYRQRLTSEWIKYSKSHFNQIEKLYHSPFSSHSRDESEQFRCREIRFMKRFR